jgi:acyl-CoA thioesterase I
MTRLIFVSLLALVSCSAAPSAFATATPRATPTPTLFVTTSAPTASPTRAAAAFRYVAIGASDTVGVGASDPRAGSWPARVAARLPAGTDYLNLGVSGSVASQAARDQVPAAIAARPQLVTIWLAVNDLNASLPASDYAAALRSVVEPLVSGTTARIFVGDVPDLRSVPAYAGTDQAALLARISAYNAAIAAIAATFPETRDGRRPVHRIGAAREHDHRLGGRLSSVGRRLRAHRRSVRRGDRRRGDRPPLERPRRSDRTPGTATVRRALDRATDRGVSSLRVSEDDAW